MKLDWIEVLMSFCSWVLAVGFWLLVVLIIKKIIERNQTKWKEYKPINEREPELFRDFVVLDNVLYAQKGRFFFEIWTFDSKEEAENFLKAKGSYKVIGTDNRYFGNNILTERDVLRVHKADDVIQKHKRTHNEA